MIGTCDFCRGMKKLDTDGLVPTHYIPYVATSALPTHMPASARKRRRCSGSRKRPRRVEK